MGKSVFFSENSILANPRDLQRNVIRNTFIPIYLAYSTFLLGIHLYLFILLIQPSC